MNCAATIRHRTLRLAALGCLFLCLAPQAMAAASDGQAAEAERPAEAGRRISPPTTRRSVSPAASVGNPASRAKTPGNSWWTTAGALGLVVALILGAGRFLRKHAPTAPGGLPQDVVRWLGKRRIDARNTIHLVRCGSRILVLGTSPQGMETLAEITEPAEVDLLTGLCRATEATSFAQGFGSLLGNLRESEASGDHSSQAVATAASRLKERLHPVGAADRGDRAREEIHG